MTYWLEQVFWMMLLAVLFIAVLWETQHLLDWFANMGSQDTGGTAEETRVHVREMVLRNRLRMER